MLVVNFLLSLLGVQKTLEDVAKQTTFPGHVLYKLNDGNYIPSPAYGVGSALYNKNATDGVATALKNGWRHIDNARVYANEKSVGEALRLADIDRSELFITSKYDAIDGEDVFTEFNKSIADLGVKYLDLYLIHFPQFADRGGGIHKVWRSFEQLKMEGRVKSIGVSNYNEEQLAELLALARIKPAVNQISHDSYSAVNNAAVMSLGNRNGMITEAYSALKPITRIPGGPADAIGEKIAKRLSKTLNSEVTVSQMILVWLKSTNVVAVTTSSNEDRIKQQLAVFNEDFPLLTAAEVKQYELAQPGWKPEV